VIQIPHLLMLLSIRPTERKIMRTTVNLDEDLLEQAKALSGIDERTALLREGLKALIERESARRLARLGGSEPGLDKIPRRKGTT
jgi:Arc/MetJ family transcription regulator